MYREESMCTIVDAMSVVNSAIEYIGQAAGLAVN